MDVMYLVKEVLLIYTLAAGRLALLDIYSVFYVVLRNFFITKTAGHMINRTNISKVNTVFMNM